ncbi:MAG: hypothetical protein HOO86_12925 [Bacteroidales bacterium]|nr:hypothetical protein [Bacteroidales bacterium]
MKTRIYLTAALFGIMLQTSIFAGNFTKVDETYINDIPFETESISDYHNRLANSVNPDQTGSELIETKPFEMPLVFHFDKTTLIQSNYSETVVDSGLNLPDSSNMKSNGALGYVYETPFENENMADYHNRLLNSVKTESARQEIIENMPYLKIGNEVTEKITFPQAGSTQQTPTETVDNGKDHYLLDLPFNTEKLAEYNNRLRNFVTNNRSSESEITEPATFNSQAVYCFDKATNNCIVSQINQNSDLDELNYSCSTVVSINNILVVSF